MSKDYHKNISDIEFEPIRFCPRCKQAIIPEEIMEEIKEKQLIKRERNRIGQKRFRDKKKKMMR